MNHQHGIELINWSAPWLAPYKVLGEAIADRTLQDKPVHVALNDELDSNPHIPCPVRFVAQEESQGAAAYESFIFATQTVPTRDNLHDFFNGLIWLHFPKTKVRLNALQNASIAAQGIGQHRGKLRDALTLFDENAAFLIEPSHSSCLFDSLQQKNWQALFVTQRAHWRKSTLILFGHALIEKLVTPRKAITAHVFCPTAPLKLAAALDFESLSALDAQIAAMLHPEHLATKPYAPLPVLGVPAWCAENSDPAFYDDVQVFRPLQSTL